MKIPFRWTSRKLWSTLIAVGIEIAVFLFSVHILKGFQNGEDKLIAGFIQIYQTFMVGLNATVLGFVGVTGVVQWKHGTEGIAQNASETVEQIERTFAPKHFDDGSV